MARWCEDKKNMEINTEVKAGFQTNHIIDLSDRLYKIILAIIGLVAVYIIGQMVYDFRALPQNYPREITVSGEGKAFTKPDIALVSLGVTTQALKSQDAVNENNSKMSEIIKAVKDLGVEDKDIQTTLYSLYPEYGTEPIYSGGLYPYPRPNNKIVGYSLNQQIQVKIRDFDKINSILDEATSKSANMLGSLQFTVDDMEKFRAEAREKAIAQAKEKAVSLFAQSGLRMGELVNIYEGGFGGCGGGICPYGLGAGGAITKDSTAPQIEPGQAEINTSVTLTYRIR